MTFSLSPELSQRKWRLVALDVDGTLLDSRHNLPPANIRAIVRVRDHGVGVVLVTSRPPGALRAILNEMQLTKPAVFICSQGALTGCYGTTGTLEIIEQHPIGLPEALAAVALCLEAGLQPNWYAGDRWLVSHVDAQIAREAQIVGCAPIVADLAAQVEGPDKILAIAADSGREMLAGLAAAMPEGLTAQTSNATYLEITRQDVDKAAALANHCRRSGIGLESVVAFGDGRNDLGMLTLAGLAVAPANAHPDVLAVADIVTSSNDDEGVARALDLLVP